jgi:hypothetical protein
MVERVATKPATRRATLRTERTFSCISPAGSVRSDEVLSSLELQQKLAEVDQNSLSRRLTKRSTSLISSPVSPVERLASVSADWIWFGVFRPRRQLSQLLASHFEGS